MMLILGYVYPDGFICDKALRPKDFNWYGLIKFKNQMESFDENTKYAIWKTMDNEDRNVYKQISLILDNN